MSESTSNNARISEKARVHIALPRGILYAAVFLALIMIMGVILAAHFLFIPWWKYRFLDRSIGFTNTDDLVINLTPLRKELADIAEQLGPDRISLYVESLNSGANIVINKDLKIFPASLAKLPLALVILKKIEAKELDENELIAIEDSDRDNRSGDLYKEPIGTKITVKDLLEVLLVKSDNTAQRILLQKISVDDMQSLIEATGLEEIIDMEGKLSAKEYTRLFRTLYYSSYLTPAHSEMVISWLGQATFKDFLSQGVPSNVFFAHKYGQNIDEQIYLDSGVMYIKNRPVMLTVMLTGVSKEGAKSAMKLISRKVYEYFAHYSQLD